MEITRYTKKDLDREARLAVNNFRKQQNRPAKLDRWDLIINQNCVTLQVYIESPDTVTNGIWTYCWNIAL